MEKIIRKRRYSRQISRYLKNRQTITLIRRLPAQNTNNLLMSQFFNGSTFR